MIRGSPDGLPHHLLGFLCFELLCSFSFPATDRRNTYRVLCAAGRDKQARLLPCAIALKRGSRSHRQRWSILGAHRMHQRVSIPVVCFLLRRHASSLGAGTVPLASWCTQQNQSVPESREYAVPRAIFIGSPFESDTPHCARTISDISYSNRPHGRDSANSMRNEVDAVAEAAGIRCKGDVPCMRRSDVCKGFSDSASVRGMHERPPIRGRTVPIRGSYACDDASPHPALINLDWLALNRARLCSTRPRPALSPEQERPGVIQLHSKRPRHRSKQHTLKPSLPRLGRSPGAPQGLTHGRQLHKVSHLTAEGVQAVSWSRRICGGEHEAACPASMLR